MISHQKEEWIWMAGRKEEGAYGTPVAGHCSADREADREREREDGL